MAVHNVIMEVDYLDTAERTMTRTYMLDAQFDDASAGPSWAAIITNAADVVAILETLSWAQITRYRLCLELENTDSAANVAANNQVLAFIRTIDDGGNKAYVEIPAWDDAVYDQNSQNMLSAAFVTVAEGLLPLLRDRETGLQLTSIAYAQSRTQKSRNVLKD